MGWFADPNIAREVALPPPPAIDGVADVPIIPGQGTAFDELIDIRDPEGAVLAQRVLDLYDAVRPVKRYRNDHEIRVRKLIANALRGYWFREPTTILYFRKADAAAYADKPRWMRHGALANGVDALVDAGLADAIVGKRMPWYSRNRSYSASYRATERLAALARECGVSPISIDRHLPTSELVKLRGPKPAHIRQGSPIVFAPTVETRRWEVELEAINAFYRLQQLALDVSAADLATWNAERKAVGAPYRLPETFRTDMYRVFNNGIAADPKFDEGGRLYGGWWMNVPERLRPNITINGLPTIELDYGECHPRMLYHQRGFDGPVQLYAVPEIAAYEKANGLAAGTFRPCLKQAMQVLINSKGRPNQADLPDDIIFPPGYSLEEVLHLLEMKHQPIADAFKTGAGMGLMRIESDIALEIVSTATAEGWSVLPIHDSFIATVDRQERLRALMVEAYFKRFRREPVIK